MSRRGVTYVALVSCRCHTVRRLNPAVGEQPFDGRMSDGRLAVILTAVFVGLADQRTFDRMCPG